MANRYRYCNFELLRVLASISIVYFHAAPVIDKIRRYSYAGIIIFLLISITLLFRDNKNNLSLSQHAVKKAVRLIYPFLAWSAFYFIVSVYTTGFDTTVNTLSFESLFWGTYYHLWYLPYLYLLSILSYFVKDFLSVSLAKKSSLYFSLFLGVLVFFIQALLISCFDISPPWIQWLSSFPCFFLGIAVGKSLKRSEILQNPIVPIIPIVVAVASILSLLKLDSDTAQMYSISYGIGISVFYLSFFLRNIHWKLINFLSGLTLGVYLIHPVVILFVLSFTLELLCWSCFC